MVHGKDTQLGCVNAFKGYISLGQAECEHSPGPYASIHCCAFAHSLLPAWISWLTPFILSVSEGKDVSHPGNQSVPLSPSSPSSLQMASNCSLGDLSVQAAGTWSERPFHLFISVCMRTYYIKPPFTLSKELLVQKK